MDPGNRLSRRRRLPRLLLVLSVLLIVAGVGAALAWFAWPSRETIRSHQPVTAKPQPVTILGGGKIISGSLSPGEVQIVDGRTISVRG